MVMKILTLLFFFEIKESKITRGHTFTLVNKQSRLDFGKSRLSTAILFLKNVLYVIHIVT